MVQPRAVYLHAEDDSRSMKSVAVLSVAAAVTAAPLRTDAFQMPLRANIQPLAAPRRNSTSANNRKR